MPKDLENSAKDFKLSDNKFYGGGGFDTGFDHINYNNPSNQDLLTELALLRAEIAKTKDLIKELQVCLENDSQR